MSLFSLKGKSVLVTGASSGIGRAIAIVCSEQGANVVIVGRNKAKLEETLALMQGENHMLYIADFTIESDIEALVDKLPKLDGIVSNIGITNPLLLQFTDSADVANIINTNAISAIHLTRLLLQNKKINKMASIIYISSINGNNSVSIGSSLYAASKSMLTGFMKAVALELASKGIRANCINPGMIETDIFANSAISEEDLETDRQKYPLKRFGKPEEVAYAAVYLLSDATKWVTGTSLVIDGGFTLV